MSGREAFDIDLAFGESREGAFYRAITEARVECKSDRKARSTGNLLIEVRQHGRPSGINVTKAKWWAIEYADDAWLVVRTSLLMALTRRARDVNGVIRCGDNGNEGVLVPIEWLIQPWRRV